MKPFLFRERLFIVMFQEYGEGGCEKKSCGGQPQTSHRPSAMRNSFFNICSDMLLLAYHAFSDPA